MKKILVLLNRWSAKQLRKKYNFAYDEYRHANKKHSTTNGLKVTDHALLRYFERFEDYDLDQIKNKIATEHLSQQIKEGVNKYVSGNMTVVIDGKYILTVYPHDNHLGNRIKGL